VNIFQFLNLQQKADASDVIESLTGEKAGHSDKIADSMSV
jgi:hypothetical protein